MKNFQKQNIRYKGQVESHKLNTINNEIDISLNSIKKDYNLLESTQKELDKLIEQRKGLTNELYKLIDEYKNILDYNPISKNGGA